MAEKRIDVKVLQYIMGHAHIDVTMDVYNHVSEMSRIESEITRLESVAISLTPKKKNWCQNGVKSRKSDDYKEEKVLQTP